MPEPARNTVKQQLLRGVTIGMTSRATYRESRILKHKRRDASKVEPRNATVRLIGSSMDLKPALPRKLGMDHLARY